MAKIIFDPLLGELRLSDLGDGLITTEKHVTETTLRIKSGCRYIFDSPITELILADVEKSNLESEIRFTAGDTILVDIGTLGTVPVEPSFEAGKSYVINICDSVAVVVEYAPATN